MLWRCVIVKQPQGPGKTTNIRNQTGLTDVRLAKITTVTGTNIGCSYGMEWFDAFEELMVSIERYVQQHGEPPHEVAVSPMLYGWLSDIRRESAALAGTVHSDPGIIPTPWGNVPLIIDEALTAYDIVPQ